MREIIAITQLTADGVMQAPGGPEEDPTGGFPYGGWFMHFGDPILGNVLREIVTAEYDLLLGRRTYDIFAGHWPKQTGHIATGFNNATKYVVTHRPDKLDWEISRRIGGDVVNEIRRLKASDGPDLHVWGSSALLQTLIGADLVDEYRFWIAPVILGEGKRLFEKGVPPRSLSLVSTQRTTTGILLNTYRSAGPFPKA